MSIRKIDTSVKIDVKDTRGPRERVFDEEIQPLVSQLIDLCQECGIPIIVGAELDTADDGEQTVCVSVSTDSAGEPSSGTVAKAAEMMIPGVTK